MKVTAFMDEVAEKLRVGPSLNGRTFAWPVSPVQPNSAIVGYPARGKFDETYGRGTDTLEAAVVLILGPVTAKQTKDQVAKYLNDDSPEYIPTLLDGDEDDYESCDGVRVADYEMDTYTIGAADHLAIVFVLAVTGPGTGRAS